MLHIYWLLHISLQPQTFPQQPLNPETSWAQKLEGRHIRHQQLLEPDVDTLLPLTPLEGFNGMGNPRGDISQMEIEGFNQWEINGKSNGKFNGKSMENQWKINGNSSNESTSSSSKFTGFPWQTSPASPAAMGLAALKIKRSPRNCSCTWHHKESMVYGTSTSPSTCQQGLTGLRHWRLEGKNDWSNNRGATHHTCKKPMDASDPAVSKRLAGDDHHWSIFPQETKQTKQNSRKNVLAATQHQAELLLLQIHAHSMNPSPKYSNAKPQHTQHTARTGCKLNKKLRFRFHKEQVKELMSKKPSPIHCRTNLLRNFIGPLGTATLASDIFYLLTVHSSLARAWGPWHGNNQNQDLKIYGSVSNQPWGKLKMRKHFHWSEACLEVPQLCKFKTSEKGRFFHFGGGWPIGYLQIILNFFKTSHVGVANGQRIETISFFDINTTRIWKKSTAGKSIDYCNLTFQPATFCRHFFQVLGRCRRLYTVGSWHVTMSEGRTWNHQQQIPLTTSPCFQGYLGPGCSCKDMKRWKSSCHETLEVLGCQGVLHQAAQKSAECRNLKILRFHTPNQKIVDGIWWYLKKCPYQKSEPKYHQLTRAKKCSKQVYCFRPAFWGSPSLWSFTQFLESSLLAAVF